MKYYKEAAEHYSLEQHNTSNYNSSMLKVVDIGIYVAAPDYGEMIKVGLIISRSWKPLPIGICRANSLLPAPKNSTSRPSCSIWLMTMPLEPIRPCNAT